MFIAAGSSLHMFNGFSDPATWAALAFVAFIAVLLWKKVPAAIASTLDDRADQIQNELTVARNLREEAQSILADYQSKQRNADQDAAEIVAQAEREANAYAEESKANLADMLERRMKSADTKIAQAELQALAEVKRAAAEVAAQATETILREGQSAGSDAALIDNAIARLNG